MSEPRLKKNLVYALGAEGLQLLQSVLMSLIIPKILGVEQFGFWQLFIFYTSYGGFFHLGLLDGIYLKTGGKHVEEVDFSQLASQLKGLFLWLLVVLTPIAVWGMHNDDPNRCIVIIASCICIVMLNILAFHSYLLQCINDIKAYSIGRFVDMASFIVGLVILLIDRVDFFLPYVIAYFAAKVISLVYYGFSLKQLWYNIYARITKPVILEMFDNIKIGIYFLASNIAGMLVLGIGRWLVDKEWGIESFSKISFSLIFVNFFLMFIQQASMVLFPDLRRRTETQVESIYSRMKVSIQCAMPLVLLAYLPFVLVIQYWFLKYSDSIGYLIYLLPLCCFETKMQLIYNTMLKVKRMERNLLLCNILSLFASALLICTAVYILQSLTCVVIAMFAAITLRSVVAEYMVERKFNLSIHSLLSDLLPEFLTVAIFMVSLNMFGTYTGVGIYSIFVIVYCISKFSTYKSVIKR